MSVLAGPRLRARDGLLGNNPNTFIEAVVGNRPITKELGCVDICPCFCEYRNMESGTSKKRAERVAKYADMFSAMGTEPRLRIMQLLLSAHPEGLVVGDIQGELEIPNSTLSHHLDKLKNEELVRVQRESTFLRYTANTEALQELLQFLYSECCTRNKALRPQDIMEVCK
jgi:ArsR family transcriptional regulator